MQALRSHSAADGRCARSKTEPARRRPARSHPHRRLRIRQQDRGEMSVATIVGRRLVFRIVLVAAGGVAIALMLGALHDACAQAGPFGAPRSQAPAAPVGGVLGWIFAKQAEFYRQFSTLLRAAKADGSAALTLFALSFLYGVLHAPGPGQVKAIIWLSSVANN